MASPAFEDNIYSSLPSSRAIRLITKAKATSSASAQLSIDIRTVSLDDIPPWRSYTALSYVWGHDRTLVEVTCNDHKQRITKNLHQALTQVWAITPTQELWVDAICVNQEDYAEKSAQVQIMGEIYRTASSVLIWLGEPSVDTELVLPDRPSCRGDQAQYFVDGLVSSSWIRRMWTLQEIVLASKAIVMYGHYWIEWRLLTEAILSTSRKVKRVATLRSEVLFVEQNRLQVAQPQRLAMPRKRKLGTQDLDLEDLILETRARDCQDPRDKIYALLAIFTNRSYYFSPVDYLQPIWIVFAHATAMTLMFDHKMSLLRMSGVFHMNPNNHAWPSWVPDLTATKLMENARSNADHSFDRIISTSKSLDGNWFDWDRPTPRILRIRAWAIGVVQSGTEVIEKKRWSKLLAFPSCCQLSQYLSSNVTNVATETKEIKAYPSKRPETVFAKDIRKQLTVHIAENCQCSKETSDLRSGMTRHLGNLSLLCFLADLKFEDWDWICEIPMDGGLCILRPSSPDQFQLVAATPSIGDAARRIKAAIAEIPYSIGRRSRAREAEINGLGLPTALMSFEVA